MRAQPIRWYIQHLPSQKIYGKNHKFYRHRPHNHRLFVGRVMTFASFEAAKVYIDNHFNHADDMEAAPF